jgi:hypothetical protein
MSETVNNLTVRDGSSGRGKKKWPQKGTKSTKEEFKFGLLIFMLFVVTDSIVVTPDARLEGWA